MQNKNDAEKPHHGHYEEKFDRTKHDVKHQAESKTEDFKHQAEKAKHKVAEIIPQPVKDTADKVSDKASQVKVTLLNFVNITCISEMVRMEPAHAMKRL